MTEHAWILTQVVWGHGYPQDVEGPDKFTEHRRQPLAVFDDEAVAQASCRALNLKAFRSCVRDLGDFAQYHAGLTGDVLCERFRPTFDDMVNGVKKNTEAKAFLEGLGLTPQVDLESLGDDPAIMGCPLPADLPDDVLAELFEATDIRFYEVLAVPRATSPELGLEPQTLTRPDDDEPLAD